MKLNKKNYENDTAEIKRLLKRIISKRETVNVNIHRNPLLKYTLREAVEEMGWEGQNWTCDGTKFTGCKSGYYGVQNNEEETLYHCAECNFDYCATCFEEYGQTHKHDLEAITFA